MYRAKRPNPVAWVPEAEADKIFVGVVVVVVVLVLLGISYSTAIRLNFLFLRAHEGRAGLKVSFNESDSKLPCVTSGRTFVDGNRLEEERAFEDRPPVTPVATPVSESLSTFEAPPPATPSTSPRMAEL